MRRPTYYFNLLIFLQLESPVMGCSALRVKAAVQRRGPSRPYSELGKDAVFRDCPTVPHREIQTFRDIATTGSCRRQPGPTSRRAG